MSADSAYPAPTVDGQRSAASTHRFDGIEPGNVGCRITEPNIGELLEAPPPQPFWRSKRPHGNATYECHSRVADTGARAS
jgi:hypothetical protein